MNGVFHSMVTQGHVSINRFLSTCHGYLGLFRSHGQRVFVKLDGAWCLLGLPSAFEMAPDCCRWIYKHAGGTIEVISQALASRNELSLEIRHLTGDPLPLLISHHVAMNGDDGNVPHPVVREDREGGIFVRAIPDSDVAAAFRMVVSSSVPPAGRSSKRWVATSCCSTTVSPAASRFFAF